MTTSSTRGSGALGVGWLASGPVTCRQLQTRVADKSKLRDKGILKAVLNVIDGIAHKLLGMDVWERGRIRQDNGRDPWWNQKRAVLVWSEFQRQRYTRHSMTVCRAGAISEVSLHTNISKSAGKATDKFMMPVLCFNVIRGEILASNILACSEFLNVPTEAGSVAEDMIIDIEDYHLLKFGHQKDVRRDVCNVGDETGFSESAVQQWHVQFLRRVSGAGAGCLATWRMESRLMSLVRPDSQERPIQLTWNQAALTAASSIQPILQASLLFPLLIRSRCYTTRSTGVLMRRWRLVLYLRRWNSTQMVGCETVNQHWTGVLRKLFGPMSLSLIMFYFVYLLQLVNLFSNKIIYLSHLSKKLFFSRFSALFSLSVAPFLLLV